MKKTPAITEAEWKVMEALWSRSPRTAQSLADELGPSNRWTQATVKTLLNRLLRKGALKHRRQGKAYLYSPAVSRTDCQRREARSFLDRVFGGAVSPMLAQLVDSKALSPEEIREIEKLIRKKS